MSKLPVAKLIVIAGPTASGKTSLAIELAQKSGAQIFNADSRQFYRLMNIGTAKPGPAEQKAVKHHFIDILDPQEDYSAGRFATDISAALTEYFRHRDVAILTGGSGLYINAALYGFDDLPEVPSEIRQKWRHILEQDGLEKLQQALKTADPEYAQQVDMQNPQRVQRALEVIDAGGRPFSSFRQKKTVQRPFETTLVLLWPERKILYDHINQRVDSMIREGLVNEVSALLKFRHHNALKTVGYSEIFSYLDGNMSLEEAVDKIKQHTRNYAKRQYTWFGAQPGYEKFETSQSGPVLKHLKEKNFV